MLSQKASIVRCARSSASPKNLFRYLILMAHTSATPICLTQRQARRIWIKAQRLDTPEPFGNDAQATRLAIEHLGYVQIDTINVIERCHHHILWTRIPGYQRAHLHQAQSLDKTVFEYWTHALSYVPVRDLPFFLADMKQHNAEPKSFLRTVTSQEVRKILNRIESEGPLSIRDIDDDELTEKEHPWGSRKPSKRVIQHAFFSGELTTSARVGIVKTYELLHRHFGWDKAPRAASQRQIEQYLLDRALRAQGVVSLDSICYLDAKRKPGMRQAIETRVKRGELIPVEIEGASRVEHWAHPSTVLHAGHSAIDAVHILSPFDPLVIQRKRLNLFFDYEHKFEAYLPKERRVYGYFGLPVLVDDEIVAVLDLKADRERRKLLVQRWTWVGSGKSKPLKARIETALHVFEKFQFAA